MPATRTKVLPSEINTPLGVEMVREWGWSLRAAKEFQHLDGEAAHADRRRLRALGKDEGQVILNWRVQPPTAYAPSSTPTQASELDQALHDRANDLLPEGASGNDYQHVLMLLAQGATDAEALAVLLDRREPTVKKWLEETGL